MIHSNSAKLDWYFHMMDYNSKQLKSAISQEDKDYYQTCREYFRKKILTIVPDFPI